MRCSVSFQDGWIFTGVIMFTMLIPVLLFACSPVSHAPASDQSAPTTAPETQPMSAESAPADRDVAAILEELEAGAQDLRTFAAQVHYEVEDSLLGEKVVRQGDIVYSDEPSAEGKRIAIRFESVIENNRRRADTEHYIFSDRWLVEIDPEQKLFIKYELAPVGSSFDPFALGEGPFPLPIGQPKDDVLARFEVSLIELPDSGPLAHLRDAAPVDGLHLVPRAGSPAAKDFKAIDLFYDRATRMPVGVNLLETNGDRRTARLDDISRNEPLDDNQLAAIDLSEPQGDWRIEIRPLKE